MVLTLYCTRKCCTNWQYKTSFISCNRVHPKRNVTVCLLAMHPGRVRVNKRHGCFTGLGVFPAEPLNKGKDPLWLQAWGYEPLNWGFFFTICSDLHAASVTVSFQTNQIGMESMGSQWTTSYLCNTPGSAGCRNQGYEWLVAANVFASHRFAMYRQKDVFEQWSGG